MIRGVELSSQYALYRQDCCGRAFPKLEREERKAQSVEDAVREE